MLRRILLGILGLFIGAFIAGCGGGGGGGGGQAPTLQSISVTPANSTITLGATQQLTATATYSNGTTSILNNATWSSSASAKATVSSSGLVSSVSVGDATITATLNGVSGIAGVTVTAATLQSIQVTPQNASVTSGLTQQLTATGTFSDGTNSVLNNAAWHSSDTAKASVSNSGQVTGVAVGAATITASLSGISGTANISVSAAALQSISVTPVNNTIPLGTTQQLVATATYSNGTTAVLNNATWTSSDNTKTSVSSSGLVSSIATGTATITATVNGISGAASVTLTTATLQSVAISPPTASVAAGLTQQLTATGTYSNGSTAAIANVTWTSSNNSVATVSAAGLARGLSVGSATMTATSGGLASTMTLTVTNATLQSIAVSPVAPSIALGLTKQFSAIGTYSDGSSAAITPTWSSSSTSVATINSAGLATSASTVGSTNITATHSGISGTTALTVTSAVVTAMSITPPATSSSPAGLTLAALGATATLSNGTTQAVSNGATWVSSNTAVATINASGVITTGASGTSTITVTYGGQTGTLSFVVNGATATSLTIAGVSATAYQQGGNYALTLTATYSDASTYTVTSAATWSSGNAAVATVSNTGVLATAGGGVTTVSAAFAGLTRTSSTITVTTPLATPVVTVRCNAATPTVVTASTWNSSYAADPNNLTKWLVVDNTSCSSYTNGILLADVTANSIISDATIGAGVTTFNPPWVASTGRTPQFTAGQTITVGNVRSRNGGFYLYYSIYTITVQ